MSLEKKLLDVFLSLPDDKKIEVIDFVEFLKSKSKTQVENAMDEIIAENLDALKELAK